MPLKEPHYSLDWNIFDGEPVPRLLKTLRQQISRSQFVRIDTEVKPVKVYTADLAFILLTKDLAAYNQAAGKETTVDGIKYFKTYFDAYIEGEKYFADNYAVSADTIYGKRGDLYIDNLRQNFFFSGDSQNKRGWNFVKFRFPLVLTKKEIKLFGFYSGIVSSVEALAEKHPKPFEAFEAAEPQKETKAAEKEKETKPTALKAAGKNKLPQKSAKAPIETTGKENFRTFEQLFFDENMIAPCIDILKKVDPPLIDEKENYIGGLKGAFVVWYNEMRRQSFVKHSSDRKLLAALFSKHFKRFNIDESMFAKGHKRAKENYELDIKTKLSQVKHSQNSQKGKLGK